MFYLFITLNSDRSVTIRADIPGENRHPESTYHGMSRGTAENAFRQQFGLTGRPVRRVMGRG